MAVMKQGETKAAGDTTPSSAGALEALKKLENMVKCYTSTMEGIFQCQQWAATIRAALQESQAASESEMLKRQLGVAVDCLTKERNEIFYCMTRGQEYQFGLAKERMTEALKQVEEIANERG